MRIAFLQYPSLDYTPVTPLAAPLGGTESAICYLASALAKHGNDIWILNQTSQPGSYDGVTCHNYDSGTSTEFLNGFDVIVSASAVGALLRQAGVTSALVFWTGHDVVQPAVSDLYSHEERGAWDAIAMVSNWQRARFVERFRLREDMVRTIPNAAAPVFETIPKRDSYFFSTGQAPTLAYTCGPSRGLQILVRALPLIRKKVPGCAAHIYSSMALYQVAGEDDPHKDLYDMCRRTEGMNYFGAVKQTSLAEALGVIDIFAYPSIFFETSCISLMEAMTAGCMPVLYDAGALSETSAGFSHIIRHPADRSDAAVAAAYADFLVTIIRHAVSDPSRAADRLARQREFALHTYSWDVVVREWERLFADLTRRH